MGCSFRGRHDNLAIGGLAGPASRSARSRHDHRAADSREGGRFIGTWPS